MCVNDILKQYERKKQNLIQILHDIQDNKTEQFLSEPDLQSVANYLNITMSEVYGVAKYYTMYSTEPRGKFIIRICKSPVCSMMGAIAVKETLKEILNIQTGETTADKLFTLEESECLGYCDKAPMIMINKEVYGDLNPNKIAKVIENYKSK